MKKDWTKKFKSEQKRSETGQIFFWSTKQNEKKTEQLVDQETDQNHMDRTIVYGCQIRLSVSSRFFAQVVDLPKNCIS